jgi:histidinol-phosphate aminotransferase
MTIDIKRRMFLGGTASALALIAAGGAGTVAAAQAGGMGRPVPRYGPPEGFAKLNANENPFGPSKAALQAMEEASRKGAYYVFDSYMKLKAMIAERNGVAPEYVTLSSGSSGALVAAAISAGQTGKILGPDLFWDTTSKSVEKQGVSEIVRLPKNDSLQIDLGKMYAAIDDSISMVQVTNPNNPTGMLVDAAELRKFCLKAAPKATVLVDEAYNELTDMPDENTMVDLVRAGHDVVVARTFSKIYGLAGMRVGYLIATPDRIAEIERFGVGWYGLNQAGLAAAVASYEDHAFMDSSRAKIKEGREMVFSALKENGVKALPSQTNFIFADLGNLNADTFRAEMEKEKVLIRGIYRDYTSWSRVSMGYIEHVEMYTRALPKVLARMNSV